MAETGYHFDMKCRLLPLASAGFLSLLLVSCEKKATVADYGSTIVKNNEERMVALKSRIDLYENQLEQKVAQGEKISQLRHDYVTLGTKRSEQRIKRAALEREVRTLRSKYEDYRADALTLARNRAIGERLETLSVPGGRSYHDVVIRKVSDVGLEIRHSEGRARVSFASLSKQWQSRFMYDEDQAQKVLELERKARHSYEMRLAKYRTERNLEATKAAVAAEKREQEIIAASYRKVTRGETGSSYREKERSSWRSNRRGRNYYRSGSSRRYYYYNSNRSSSCVTPRRTVRNPPAPTRVSKQRRLPVVPHSR